MTTTTKLYRHLDITLQKIYLGGVEGSTTREKAATIIENIAFSQWDTGSIPVASTLENYWKR
jgi:hypothetical protein